MTAIPLSQPVQNYVSTFIGRQRRLSLIKAAGIAIAVTLVWMLASCMIDRLAPLPGWVRLVLLLTNLAAVAVILFRPIRDALRGDMNWIDATATIERHNPTFGQRLQTITSQMLAPAGQRGSTEILEHLTREVDKLAVAEDSRVLLPPKLVYRPWMGAAALFVIVLLLLPFDWLSLGDLIGRYFLPLSHLGPVTTTRLLEITPGNTDVKQGDALPISLRVKRLGEGVVTLHTNTAAGADAKENEEAWTSSPMIMGADERFVFNVTSVDRDIRYYITAGDAKSPEFAARVLRRPAVAEFRVRYSYPAYTGRPPLTVSNTDGLIEAPVGTEATLMIAATEPLASATLTIDGVEDIIMSDTLEPTVRQAKFTIKKDSPYEVHMSSTREISGGGPQGTVIRAVPDRAPIVRILQPGDDLRLHPRDIVAVQYQAMDDYRIDKLWASVQINAQPTKRVDIPMRGDTRRQDAVFNLDLAAFDLKVSDIVAFNFQAQDSSGQISTSETRHILVSPRSIDLDTHLRIAELKNAVKLAEDLKLEIDESLKSLDQARATGFLVEKQYMAAFSAFSQHLAVTTETATMLRLSLGRTILRSNSPGLSTVLANFIDVVQVQTGIAEDVSSVIGMVTPQTDAPRAKLVLSQQQATQLLQQLKVIAEGEQAAALLADRQNLIASEKTLPQADPATAERLKQTLARAREDIAAGATTIGLNPAAGDLDAQLTNRINAAVGFINAQRPMDFAAVAAQWVQELITPKDRNFNFDQRLAAAAQAEAIRPDADMIRARDLTLAARAAAVLQLTVVADNLATTRPSITVPQVEYPPAMTALQAEHTLNRRPKTDVLPPDQVKTIHDAAAVARHKMMVWAGEVREPNLTMANADKKDAAADASANEQPGADAGKPKDDAAKDDPSAPKKDAGEKAKDEVASAETAQELAIKASAAAQEKDYDKAKKLDDAAAKKLAEQLALVLSPVPDFHAPEAKTIPDNVRPMTPEEAKAVAEAVKKAEEKNGGKEDASKTPPAGQQPPTPLTSGQQTPSATNPPQPPQDQADAKKDDAGKNAEKPKVNPKFDTGPRDQGQQQQDQQASSPQQQQQQQASSQQKQQQQQADAAATPNSAAQRAAQKAAEEAQAMKEKQDATEKAMARAKELDRIAAEQAKARAEAQKKIDAAKADPTKASEPAAELAGKQAEIAKAIAEVQKDEKLDLWGDLWKEEDEDTREEATAAIMAIQEQLAAMPQQLADVTKAANEQREATARETQAKAAEAQAKAAIAAPEAALKQQETAKKTVDDAATKARNAADEATAKADVSQKIATDATAKVEESKTQVAQQTEAQKAATDAVAKAQAEAAAAAAEAAAKTVAAEKAAAEAAAKAKADAKAAADAALAKINTAKAAADQMAQQAAAAKAAADQAAAAAAAAKAAAEAQATAADNAAKAQQAQVDAAKANLEKANQAQAAAAAKAEEAKAQVADAATKLDDKAKPVAPVAGEAISAKLEKFEPETETAQTAVEQKLLPALRALDQQLKANNNPGAIDQMTAQARTAIDQVQAELRKSQEDLIERDPLIAAKAFAEAAAQAMRKEPPDLTAAAKMQDNTSVALQKAWDNQIQQAAQARMQSVPGMSSLFSLSGLTIQGEGAGTGTGRSSKAADAPAMREWGRLRARENDNLNASIRDSDPPEYQEALKIYFETLGKSQVEGTPK